MRTHFHLVGEAQDAIIRGDLDVAKDAMRRLEAYRTQDDLPDVWRPYLAEMKELANITAESWDLKTASGSLARTGLGCASCHTALSAGPTLKDVPPPPDYGDTYSHMGRHAWAIQLMWEGIIAPSQSHYVAGASALAATPMLPHEPNGDLPAAVSSLENAVHELSGRAAKSDDEEERAHLFGELLATCAACHAAVNKPLP